MGRHRSSLRRPPDMHMTLRRGSRRKAHTSGPCGLGSTPPAGIASNGGGRCAPVAVRVADRRFPTPPNGIPRRSAAILWCQPQRDSNPCLHLERVVSYRWGRAPWPAEIGLELGKAAHRRPRHSASVWVIFRPLTDKDGRNYGCPPAIADGAPKAGTPPDPPLSQPLPRHSRLLVEHLHRPGVLDPQPVGFPPRAEPVASPRRCRPRLPGAMGPRAARTTTASAGRRAEWNKRAAPGVT